MNEKGLIPFTPPSAVELAKLSDHDLAVRKRELQRIISTPASPASLDEYRLLLIDTIKVPSTILNPKVFMRAQIRKLQEKGYPATVLRRAYDDALEEDEWTPETSTQIRRCEKHLKELRYQLGRIRDEQQGRIEHKGLSDAREVWLAEVIEAGASARIGDDDIRDAVRAFEDWVLGYKADFTPSWVPDELTRWR